MLPSRSHLRGHVHVRLLGCLFKVVCIYISGTGLPRYIAIYDISRYIAIYDISRYLLYIAICDISRYFFWRFAIFLGVLQDKTCAEIDGKAR